MVGCGVDPGRSDGLIGTQKAEAVVGKLSVEVCVKLLAGDALMGNSVDVDLADGCGADVA
ncbi:hypothetical protein GOACH_75_00010 [Gordonia aichiensis NBRC 108223]|uniref:Uncharacterized protein n=1 Tax=Gordonia aichiensis NBRC 108223 TaxID=1220583 RepID=L7KTK2_9ACTN|nr:hypothetical protein GOACH_75_00010 [Gordonia aichiensis NBRC 108223]